VSPETTQRQPMLLSGLGNATPLGRYDLCGLATATWRTRERGWFETQCASFLCCTLVPSLPNTSRASLQLWELTAKCLGETGQRQHWRFAFARSPFFTWIGCRHDSRLCASVAHAECSWPVPLTCGGEIDRRHERVDQICSGWTTFGKLRSTPTRSGVLFEGTPLRVTTSSSAGRRCNRVQEENRVTRSGRDTGSKYWRNS